MSADSWFWTLLPIMGAALWITIRWPVWSLEARVRGHMLDGGPRDVEKLRTLLLLDGHRMPKKLRDALAVWLSERDGGAS